MERCELFTIIKDAAFEVRKAFSRGYLETVYKNALLLELRSRGLRAEMEFPIAVMYKGVKVGQYYADIMVENKVILEIKAVNELSVVHEAQLVNYLVSTGIDYGYLINYGGDAYRIILKSRIYKPSSRYGTNF